MTNTVFITGVCIMCLLSSVHEIYTTIDPDEIEFE